MLPSRISHHSIIVLQVVCVLKLRQCRFTENAIRANTVADSLQCKDTTLFWVNVNITNRHIPLASKVGDVVSNEAINK